MLPEYHINGIRAVFKIQVYLYVKNHLLRY